MSFLIFVKSLIGKYKNGKKRYENYADIIRKMVKNTFIKKGYKIQIQKKYETCIHRFK